MGKTEKSGDNVPGMSPQTEASKLLEQALMQMDGIISGNSGSLNGAHSSEFGFPVVPPGGVREAANTLATALQAVATPPPPEPHVVKVLTRWLQQVSF
nr:unnamed protein product [Callosobruchus chinensis]